MKTWRPQRREYANVDQVCEYIARNSGLKTLEVSPKSAANILKSIQTIQRVVSANASPRTIIQIMGVDIVVDYENPWRPL